MEFAASVTLGLAGLFAIAWSLRATARGALSGQARSIANDMPLTAALAWSTAF